MQRLGMDISNDKEKNKMGRTSRDKVLPLDIRQTRCSTSWLCCLGDMWAGSCVAACIHIRIAISIFSIRRGMTFWFFALCAVHHAHVAGS